MVVAGLLPTLGLQYNAYSSTYTIFCDQLNVINVLVKDIVSVFQF